MKSRLFSISLSAVFIVIALVGEGCKKSPLPPPVSDPPPMWPSPLLLAIKGDSTYLPVESYDYNAQGLLSKVTNCMNPGVPVYFFYSAAGQPAAAKTLIPNTEKANDTYKFYYAGGRLDKIEMIYTGFDSANTKPNYIFKYNYAQGRLVEILRYGSDVTEANPAGRTTYTYYANGDVKSTSVEEKDFATNAFHLAYALNFEYDTKFNPLKKWGELLPGFGTYLSASSHNIAKQVTVEEDARKVTEVLTRTYTYNDKGYPLTADERVVFPQDPSGPGLTQKLIYTYQ